MLITSLKNPRIRHLQNLDKPRNRREHQQFVIEGIREVSLAQQAGYELSELYLSDSIYRPDPAYPINLKNLEVIDISSEVFGKLAYRERTGGVLAIASVKSTSLAHLSPKANPVYLILENVEKPGNIGAMLRTADAAAADAVIVCDPATDFFNPNVIRSSVGCVFTVPLASGTNEEVYQWLKARGVVGFAAALTDQSQPYHQHDYSKGCAFILGAEAEGLSGFWLQHADHQVIIPMRGQIDSMNVSNAAAVLIFEAMRQRDFQ